jgi:hypothetical protein
MLESMLTSSMTCSMQLAEEAMQHDKHLTDTLPEADCTEGRQQVAHAIDAGNAGMEIIAKGIC